MYKLYPTTLGSYAGISDCEDGAHATPSLLSACAGLSAGTSGFPVIRLNPLGVFGPTQFFGYA